MGSSQSGKKLLENIYVYIFLSKINIKYNITKHFLYSYSSIETNNKLRQYLVCEMSRGLSPEWVWTDFVVPQVSSVISKGLKIIKIKI